MKVDTASLATTLSLSFLLALFGFFRSSDRSASGAIMSFACMGSGVLSGPSIWQVMHQVGKH